MSVGFPLGCVLAQHFMHFIKPALGFVIIMDVVGFCFWSKNSLVAMKCRKQYDFVFFGIYEHTITSSISSQLSL